MVTACGERQGVTLSEDDENNGLMKTEPPTHDDKSVCSCVTSCDGIGEWPVALIRLDSWY